MIEAQWRTSAHAIADRTPLFRAMKQAAGSEADCLRCHAPLTGQVDPALQASKEAITCDACHLLRHVVPSRQGATLVHELGDNVKFGPFCDLPDNYFHKVGCSPLHAESAFCGGCHLYYVPTRQGPLPVFTEYEEWLALGEKTETQTCQSCHMPGGTAEIAVGATSRIGVGHHGFFGDQRTLRRTALAVSASLRQSPQLLRVQLSVSNNLAQHSVPTGLPGRRVRLAVSVEDPAGAVVERKELFFARILVDDTGVEVPFYAATRVGSDNRLLADETRQVSFELKAPAAGVVRIEVDWLATGDEVGQTLAVALAPEPLRSVVLHYGPHRPLPRTVKLK